MDTGLNGTINKLGVFKRSYADLINAFNNGGFKGLSNAISFFLTKTDIDNIDKYNTLIKKGVSSQTAWYQTMQTSSRVAQELIISENGAAVSTEKMIIAQKQMTIGAKAATVATKALAIAGNMLAMWAVTKVVSELYELSQASAQVAKKVLYRYYLLEAVSIEYFFSLSILIIL